MTDSLSPDTLGVYCRDLRRVAHEGMEWLVANTSWIPQNLDGKIREMRRQCVDARRLERAANRKMCIGVFGPSQAGKSFLISALAREGTKPLMADFGGSLVNFIDDINPVGGKETTGLVTRFTMDRSPNMPPGNWAELRLLTEQDVVKMLANAYVHDIDHSDEDEESHDVEKVEHALVDLEKRAQGQPYSRLDSVDIVEIETYCESRLRKAPRIKVLQRTSYWRVATRIGPFLSLQDRAELFGLIWDNIYHFTNVYQRLTQALEQVGFATSLYVKFEDALKERRTSIIGVDALSGIGEGRGDTLPVVSEDGRNAMVLREELAAITAELRIVMANKPFDFFDHTDLLDFPGYRARNPVAKSGMQKFLAENGMKEFIIRGKVAYLFERYSDEQELTSLLLCQGPENFEVWDLVPVVYDWICSSNGTTPDRRSADKTSLFFIMMKYDRIFEQSSGKNEDADRFHSRLEGSLLNTYGKYSYDNGSKSWVQEWLPGNPFNNVFLLRNPAIVQDSLFDYCEKTEVGLRPDKVEYVSSLRRVFVNDSIIRQYHANPEVAWDAMMQLNDGGISRIADSLRPVCNPDTKRQQVMRKANELREHVFAHLQPFFHSGDVAEQRLKKRQFLQRVGPQLKKCLDTNRFAEFLKVLQVDPSELYAVYELIERRPVVEAEPALSIDLDEAGNAALLDDLLGLGTEAPRPTVSAPSTVADMPTRFAAGVENYWNERLASLPNDLNLLHYFFMSREDIVGLAQEMIYAAKRTGLSDQIVKATQAGAAFRNIPKASLIWKQAKPAAQVVNEFVATLRVGVRDGPDGTEVEIDGRKIRIFVPPGPVAEEPQLGEERSRFDTLYFTDWLRGLFHMAQENVEFEAGIKVNVEANATLGVYLGELRKPVPGGG